MTAWPKVRLGEMVSPVARGETPFPGTTYRQVGVKLWGEGAYERESIDGAQTKYAQLFRTEDGDIIVNKIWARNGSVTVVSAPLAGCYGSGEFPMFVPHRERLEPRWIHWLTKTQSFWSQCDEKSQGTSGKNRIRPERFLEIEVPLPPLAEQRRIVARIEEMAAIIAEAKGLKQRIQEDERGMLLAAFNRIVAGVQHRPMRDVAPIVRRPIPISIESEYPELGVRSFGRGTFHKPPLAGIEVGSKKLFEIRPGDLLFNNVFAWEGAVAVARPEDGGRYGSHRFITCVPRERISTSTFLCFHFLTRKGLEQLGPASPGGAGRNRTLGLAALEPRLQMPRPAVRSTGRSRWDHGSTGWPLPVLDKNPVAELIDHGDHLIGAAFLDEFSRDLPVQQLLTGEQP